MNTMAGIHDDIPDSPVGRFICKLDQVQHRSAKCNTDATVAVHGMVVRQEQAHMDLSQGINDIGERAAQLHTSFGRIVAQPPTAGATHCGPGTDSHRASSYIDECELFLHDLQRPATSLTVPPATEQFDTSSAPASVVLPTKTSGQETPAQIMQRTGTQQQHDVDARVRGYVQRMQTLADLLNERPVSNKQC